MSAASSPALTNLLAALADALKDPDVAALLEEHGLSTAASPSASRPTLLVEEAAEFLRLPPITIRQWAREGRLIGYKAGRQWVFFRDDLERALRTGQLAS